jgi:hypothetical protein
MIEISRQSTDEDEVILYRSVSGNHIYFQILLNEESIILLIVDKETDTIVEFVVDNKSFTYFYGLETWLLRNVISEFRTLDIGNFKFFSKIADSKNLFEFDMVSNTIKKPPQKIRYQPLEINQVMVSELLNISTLSTLTTSLFASGQMAGGCLMLFVRQIMEFLMKTFKTFLKEYRKVPSSSDENTFWIVSNKELK